MRWAETLEMLYDAPQGAFVVELSTANVAIVKILDIENP